MLLNIRLVYVLLLLVSCLTGCNGFTSTKPTTIKAMTYNLWGRVSGERLAEFIDAADVGIIATQENGNCKNLEKAAELLGPEWSAIYPGFNTPHLKQPPERRPNFWVGGHHMPAALITKYPIVEHQFYNIKDTPDDWIDARIIECYRSCLRVRLQVDEDQFVTVFSLHGNPWNGQWRIREFAGVIKQLDGYHPDDPTIILGDFNAIPYTDSPKDPNDAKSTKLLSDAGFVDTFRAIHPDPATHPGLTHKAGRIDLIYVRNVERIVESFVVEEPTFGSKDAESDHQPYVAELIIR